MNKRSRNGVRYSDEEVARVKAIGKFISYKTIAEETGISLSSVTYWCGGYYKRDVAPCPVTIGRMRALIRGEAT